MGYRINDNGFFEIRSDLFGAVDIDLKVLDDGESYGLELQRAGKLTVGDGIHKVDVGTVLSRGAFEIGKLDVFVGSRKVVVEIKSTRGGDSQHAGFVKMQFALHSRPDKEVFGKWREKHGARGIDVGDDGLVLVYNLFAPPVPIKVMEVHRNPVTGVLTAVCEANVAFNYLKTQVVSWYDKPQKFFIEAAPVHAFDDDVLHPFLKQGVFVGEYGRGNFERIELSVRPLAVYNYLDGWLRERGAK